MYTEVTNGIRVSVEPIFLDDQSSVDEGRFVWAYRVEIENCGRKTVQLLRRYWRITDGRGRVQEVRGDGVVGEQPVISPGAAYAYTSGCPLETPSGFMTGSYEMVDEDGRSLAVSIPTFSLDSPYQPAMQRH